ncbi:MAG: sensor histidine kinase [Intrasporangium sp.]|uniref:sensor histidine kinase n=1 Tax=Intrasporangium sp. TaxID=1925024 RepID=UPI003F81F043
MLERALAPRPPVWVQDAVLAVVIAAVQVLGTATLARSEPTTVLRPLADLGHLGYVVLVTTGLVVSVRRRLPVLAFAVTAAGSLVYYALDYPDGPGWIGLFVALYTLTVRGDGRRSVVLAGVGIATLTVVWLIAAQNIQPKAAIGWVFFRIGASIMSAALGESVRSRRVIVADALDRADLAERTREEEARARVAQERVRIAREVHDTVAHAIAVINVQAGVTAHVLDQRPDRAREALVSIEQTSARALHEMRTVLGVLRGDDDSRAPFPGVDQIGDLVEHARRAGLDVHVDDTQPMPLPSVVSSAAYRIVQESITNVLRHVGPTKVTVALRNCADELEIHVIDEGRGKTRARPPEQMPKEDQGRGIRGMRERCELLGGHLSAGPRHDDPGFAVHATIPLAPTGEAGPAWATR